MRFLSAYDAVVCSSLLLNLTARQSVGGVCTQHDTAKCPEVISVSHAPCHKLCAWKVIFTVVHASDRAAYLLYGMACTSVAPSKVGGNLDLCVGLSCLLAICYSTAELKAVRILSQHLQAQKQKDHQPGAMHLQGTQWRSKPPFCRYGGRLQAY